MKEIGSEFWTGCTALDGSGIKEILPRGMETLYTLSGRTALELTLRDILQTRPVRSAYLPSYCCHTMIEPFVAKNVEVQFYDVFFTETGIGCDFREDNGCDLVFLMDYFGFRDRQTATRAAEQKRRGKVVVYDATHGMFCENMDYSACDYVFGSFRKWCDVNAGFCAKRGDWHTLPQLQENHWYTEKRNQAFEDKRRYLAGEVIEKSAFLGAFSEAEAHLEENYQSYGPDSRSRKVLATLNVDLLRKRRRENAAFVLAAISKQAMEGVRSPYRELAAGDCPMMVPLQIRQELRPELRKALCDRRIYLPIHWPLSSLHRTTEANEEIYHTELSFVCDQRYSLPEMEQMVQAIHTIWKECN